MKAYKKPMKQYISDHLQNELFTFPEGLALQKKKKKSREKVQ